MEFNDSQLSSSLFSLFSLLSFQYHCRDTQISGPASEGIGYETNITVCGYEPCQEVQCRVFPYVPLAGHPTVVHTSPKTRTASAGMILSFVVHDLDKFLIQEFAIYAEIII